MTAFDPKDGMLRIISGLVIFDAAILSLLTWLIVHNIVPLYATALVTYPVLFVANFLVIWRAYTRRKAEQGTTKLARLMWLPAIVFTGAGVVAIVTWFQNPNIRSTFQAILGTVLAGWMWFLVAYHSRAGRES